ncbi:tyrosine-protein phosphatase [Thaumasiovibrio sp. DFM-14]|uniref:phosphatase domain-containing putative toxin n=1 Tax=Thaumasiovibrio sp. DFM-14 TaxID=3384792 RepID=UPI0039A39D28
MTHPTWELPVTEQGAALILTPCPGTKGIDLVTSIQQLKEQGATVVVTALSNEEMEKAGVAALPKEIEAAGLAWFHLPIEDDEAPRADFNDLWQAALPELQQRVAGGEKIVMHCMGGSGRTGLLAAHLLLSLGWDISKIKTDVQALRPGAFTKQVQIDYIDSIAAQ